MHTVAAAVHAAVIFCLFLLFTLIMLCSDLHTSVNTTSSCTVQLKDILYIELIVIKSLLSK